jgi:hypothetical protein
MFLHISTTAAQDKATKKRQKVDSSNANPRVEQEGHASSVTEAMGGGTSHMMRSIVDVEADESQNDGSQDSGPTRFHPGSEDGVSVHPEPSTTSGSQDLPSQTNCGSSAGGSLVHTTTNTAGVADTMQDAADKEETDTLTSKCMVSVQPEPSSTSGSQDLPSQTNCGSSAGGSLVHTTTNTAAVADTMQDAADKEETDTLTSKCMVLRPSLENLHGSPPRIHAEFLIIIDLFVDRPVNPGDYGDGNVLALVLKLSESDDQGGTISVGRDEAEAQNLKAAQTFQVYI